LLFPDMNTGDAEGDTYASIEGLIGSAFDDALIGNSGNNILQGGAGNDELSGNGGTDTLEGGEGNDRATFSGSLASYVLQDFGSKIVLSGPDGADTLVSIELLEFNDGTVHVNDGDALFDTLFYMHGNPDVFHAGVDALGHFKALGRHEGRDPNAFFDTSGY